MNCCAEYKEIESRYKEKNELAEDLGEEDAAALREKAVQAETDYSSLKAVFESSMGRIKQIKIDTAVSKESMRN